ncbi:MAG: hypothetical protein DYG89_03975 [Caldilinea sp. CFX5]|nr:hypothetical protein [Caldilinea sp. CFX5]
MKSIYLLTGLLLAGAGFTLCGWLFWPAAQWLANLFITFQITWFVLALPIAITASLSVLTRRSMPSKRRATAKTKEQRTMASFEQYQAWCLQRIGQLVIDQQIHCQASAQRGPFTLHCTLRLTADPVGGLRKLLALGPSLRMVLQTNVRVIQMDQGVIIEAELPPSAHITPNAAKLLKATRWPQIAIGIDQHMRPITINPELHGALYWVAPPRAGKTQSMRSTLYLMRHTAPDLRFLILAIPSKIREDWGCFAGVSGCLGLVGDYVEMEQALAWVVAAMESGRRAGKTIIVVDDLTMLMLHAPGISTAIDSLALTGPGLGYHLMVGTHGAGSITTTGGRMVNFAMTCKILFKPADNNTGARSSGRRNRETGLAQLSGAPGDAILDENGRITRLATARVADLDILALPAADKPALHPWRHESQPASPPPTRRPPSPIAPPPAPQRDARDTVTRDALLAQVPTGMFPIKPVRDLDAEEANWLRTLHASGLFTDSGLTMLVYGDRNPRRLARIRSLLGKGDAPLTEQDAAAILEGDPAHPRRPEALRFFNLGLHEANVSVLSAANVPVLSAANVSERSVEPCAN